MKKHLPTSNVINKDQIKRYSKEVLLELGTVLSSIKESEVQQFIHAITNSKKIVVYGAGRMGLMSTAFAMRLTHLGFQGYVLGNVNTPSVHSEDLLILSSSSGETETVYRVAKLGKEACVKIALITSRPNSRIGKLADIIVTLDVPNKLDTTRSSIQPMTTLSEQSLMIFFDILVLLLMKVTHQTSDDLWKRHSNLE